MLCSYMTPTEATEAHFPHRNQVLPTDFKFVGTDLKLMQAIVRFLTH